MKKSAASKQAEEPTTLRVGMDRYKTRPRANTPRRVSLFDPATGEPTDDYLEVFSSLSDKFRAARDKAMQEAGSISEEADLSTRQEYIKEQQLRMFASLVAGWSFDQKCTESNVIEFLREAPQVQNMLVAAADDTENFFGQNSTV